MTAENITPIQSERDRPSAAVNDRNPTGMVLTQEQKDELEREGYWDHAIRYGLEYYVSGRFATAHGFISVNANILHHGAELLLKACLAEDDPIGKIRLYGNRNEGYFHDIVQLWQEFKSRQTVPPPVEFDAIVEGLHEFEHIRYPEFLIRNGAMIRIDIFDVETPPDENPDMREKKYALKLPQIDRLMGLLLAASAANESFFLSRITNDKQAMIYYNMIRPTLFGRAPSYEAESRSTQEAKAATPSEGDRTTMSRLYVHYVALLAQILGTVLVSLDLVRIGVLASEAGYASAGGEAGRFPGWIWHGGEAGAILLLVGIALAGIALVLEHRELIASRRPSAPAVQS